MLLNINYSNAITQVLFIEPLTIKVNYDEKIIMIKTKNYS